MTGHLAPVSSGNGGADHCCTLALGRLNEKCKRTLKSVSLHINVKHLLCRHSPLKPRPLCVSVCVASTRRGQEWIRKRNTSWLGGLDHVSSGADFLL